MRKNINVLITTVFFVIGLYFGDRAYNKYITK